MASKHRQKHGRKDKAQSKKSAAETLPDAVLSALHGSEQDIQLPSELLDDLIEGGRERQNA